MPEQIEKEKKSKGHPKNQTKPTSCRPLQFQREYNIALQIQIYIHYNSMADF